MRLPRDDSPVYVPACPSADRRGLGVETRRLAGGERVGLGFSSPQALAEQLGPAQPWICLTMESYAAFLTGNGIRHVQLDPELSRDLPRWTPALLHDVHARRHGGA